MLESKTYTVPLQNDLSGWKRIRVQVDVLSTGSKKRIVKLKEDFEVNLIEGDTDAFAISDKQLINEGSSVQFYVTVSPNIDPVSEARKLAATLEVKVRLDLAAMAQAVGAALAGMMPGMGFLGGAIAQGLPQEMELLTGTIAVKAETAIFELSLKKFRWLPIEKKRLDEYLDVSDIKNLYKNGGELWVPVEVEPNQKGNSGAVNFSPGIQIYDLEGELNWMGTKIAGEFRDYEHTCVVFKINPAASAANASDIAPGSPTKGTQTAAQV
ncbi:MAG: hypothetical protein N2491_03140 [Negativicutes bacterium]|nr:hypothetical protein [Negativicutes bacterium]